MKFIRKKILKGRVYYYFEYPLRVEGERIVITRYLGKELSHHTGSVIQNIFREIAAFTEKKIGAKTKAYFMPKSIFTIEESHFWYQSIHHELFESDLRLFRSLFGILFILNSNRAEGSKVTRRDIEKIMYRKRTPKTPLEREILNSLAALRFAFSKEMKWNLRSLKKIHALLFDGIFPEIAGQFKKEDNIIGGEFTTSWKRARKELSKLLDWFIAQKKKLYPPLCAVEFHHRFEGIHPFLDGNGRVGRLLCNAFLLQSGYMPVIFFSENHDSYINAISLARQGRKKKLARYFIEQVKKTRGAVLRYKEEGIIRGGSPQVGQWEIERGKIRIY